jgi:ABC-type nitrate/sulfonate/bicarbonate transport system substrate-binding protein
MKGYPRAEERENLHKQNKLFWLLGFILCSLVSLPIHAAQPTRDFKEIKVAYPPSMASVTLMTAIKQKFFDEEGLRPVLLVLTSDLALKSQVAGEIDYTLFGGGSGILAAAQGLPIKTVHLAFNFADLTLVARPEIKSVAQLRGKKIAVSGFSGSVYSSTRAMLSSGGLDPDKDATIIPMGRENVRLQALFSGSVDATPLPNPLQVVAEEKGYNLVADIEGKFEVPFSGLTVTDKKLKENPEEVKRIIRALVRAGIFFMSHRAESVALYMDWLKLSQPIAERAYTRTLRSISPDGLGKEAAIKNQLDLVKKTIGKDVKQGDAVDFSLLKQVLAEMKR